MGGQMFLKLKRKKADTGQQHVKKSRKESRKEKRKEKKLKKNKHFQRLKLGCQLDSVSKKHQGNNEKVKQIKDLAVRNKNIPTKLSPQMKILKKRNESQLELERQNEKQIEIKLERDMKLQRKKQLTIANLEEDKIIKKLEKHLKMNKRKNSSLPKSFAAEGLDYLLEVCDSGNVQAAVNAEINRQESGSEFEEDIAVATGQQRLSSSASLKFRVSEFQSHDSDSNLSEDENSGTESDFALQNLDSGGSENETTFVKSMASKQDASCSVANKLQSKLKPQCNKNNANTGVAKKDLNALEKKKARMTAKTVRNLANNNVGNDKKMQASKRLSNFESDDANSDLRMSDFQKTAKVDESFADTIVAEKTINDEAFHSVIYDKTELWEDIYGRTRDKSGNVIHNSRRETGAYVPPHKRLRPDDGDNKRAQELSRLRRQIKGLLNRLAENNMHSIAVQMDELYMKNSRNDMNESLTALLVEALIISTLTPERLIMEHMMLLAILHANVGTEVGAHFLQCMVQLFDAKSSISQKIQDKELDNVILTISHLYNFKVFHCSLMFDILNRLSESFAEKEVELILLVLHSVGFSLRKDDPLALKQLILKLQLCANRSTHLRESARIRFMLDMLLAIKNNNISKMPQFDPSYSEHLKKLIKAMIRKGNYITELKISLQDLLKADEQGRWWVVGSAWSGSILPAGQTEAPQHITEYSQTVLQMARKQRMNTDTRRNIFCILITAEDYMDAFEKLLRLGLKGQPEQEIIHVLLHCLLQEKDFNPYYTHLASQLSVADRRHQMSLQYSLWDKLKELSNLSPQQITNLARFLSCLFLQKTLPISVLKVVEFAEMDKSCVRLLRQLLLTVLLHDPEEVMLAVFQRVAGPAKLKMFREGLRLFVHHFVLRNADKSDPITIDRLKHRVRLAEQALSSNAPTRLYS